MKCKRIGLFAAWAALAAASAAGATDLPTYINGYAQAGAVTDGDGSAYTAAIGTTASGRWSANDGLASASASLTGGPVVLLGAAGNVIAGGSAYAATGISYFITVSGPAGFTDLVPIRFAANLLASESVGGAPQGYDGSPHAYAGAAFSLGGDLYTSGASDWELSACNTACASGRFVQGRYIDGSGSPTLSFALSGLTGLRVGGMGVISETVQIQTGVGGFFTDGIASASASADPYFFIDPDFLVDHPDVTLTVSSQVGNSPIGGGAPEPAAWALMLVGFGTLGAVLRRRRADRMLLAHA